MYRFGPYEVRPRTQELFKHGVRVKLRPQPFRVLQSLLERAGDAVPREELRQMLWPEETFVDFEHGLNTSIKELRHALRDSASSPRYIETLPKLGYRMAAPVEVVEVPVTTGVEESKPAAATAASSPSESSATGLAPPHPLPPARHPDWPFRTWSLVLGSLVLLVTVLGSVWAWHGLKGERVSSPGRVMLAVLPFENLTGDPAQEYLSDGLTEEVISQLGGLNPQRLGVIARTSAMHYKGNSERVEQIGQELNVQYLLEGSLRKEAGRVRVAAQLIRVSDETHTWAREYDRQLGGLLTLQSEIAREISDEIQAALGDRPAKRPVERAQMSAAQSEAHDFYLRGLYFWNKRTVEDFWRAIDYFQKAIQKDATHAPSYAGLADCYAMLGGYSGEARPEYMINARSAALRALEIDPSLPEAHTALAVIVQNYDRDWQAAGNEYRRAIQLNPSYAMAHQWYAEHLGYLGRFDEAFAESERARRLDPLSLIVASDNGVLLIYSRQYDRAIRKCRSALELDSTFGQAESCVVRAQIMQREFRQALTTLEFFPPDTVWQWSWRGLVYGRSGQLEQARRALEKLKQLYQQQQTDPDVFVTAYLGLGDKDQAFAWLEKGYAQHSNLMTTLKVDPVFDPLRGDPRFQDLLRRVGLAP